jgi:predicted membrane channel-forming protein YqfA (hemolysin III family)
MSKKWQRVKKWDAEHLIGPLAPVRWVLGALSSISLAVVLLVFVALYGALASVPIGLVALAPTYLVVALTALVAIVAGGGLLAGLVRMTVSDERRGLRFTLSVLLGLLGALGGYLAWQSFAWPAMQYNPETGEGLRFFASFVAAYDGTTLRRLPGFEMTELEFYSWWPLRVVLVLFVLNMMVATIRRIEFNFKNLGVLTVHTGIIVIALGSVYYQALKKEGDALLRAGVPTALGEPTVGSPVRGFWDNTKVALWVAQRQFSGSPLWDERPLTDIPRYNDYNLVAAVPEPVRETLEGGDRARVAGTLAQIDPPRRPPARPRGPRGRDRPDPGHAPRR